MAFDRALFHDETRGDLRVRQPLGDQAQDFPLPSGEGGELGGLLWRGRLARTNCWMSRRVIEGSISALPSATLRTAATSWSPGASLSRKPLAPARSAE